MIPRGLHVHMAGESCPIQDCPWPPRTAVEPEPDALSTSARLAKAERERDEALDDAASLRRSLAAANSDRAAAGTELERLREDAARGWIVARDGGRDCVRCEQEIRRGEAYELLPGADELRHIHCRDTEGAPTT